MLDGSTPLVVDNKVVELVLCCVIRGPPDQLMNVLVWEDCSTNDTVVVLIKDNKALNVIVDLTAAMFSYSSVTVLLSWPQ